MTIRFGKFLLIRLFGQKTWIFILKLGFLKPSFRDLRGGPMAKNELPVLEVQVQSLIRELDPTWHN